MMTLRNTICSPQVLLLVCLSLTAIGCGRGDDFPPSGDGDSGGDGDGGGSGGLLPFGSGGSIEPGGGSSAGGGTSTGGTNPGSGASLGGDGGDYIFPDGRGPVVAFRTYEAEDMNTNGSVLGPTRQFGQVAAEASGRMAVRLDAEGEQVSFQNQTPSNSVVVRYSIPNNGLDYWTKLTVLVDGQERVKLDVTSRYSWSYRNDDDNIFNKAAQKDPNAGQAHHFFDETRALVGDIPVGATVTIAKSSGDSAAHYDIDLVEMEQVSDPLPKPAGFKSIVDDCGATNNGDADDDTSAIQYCLDNPGAGIFIPPGVYHVKSAALEVNQTTIRGAGMWHSTIMGEHAHFACWNGDCKYYDFALFGDTVARYDDAPDAAFDGNDNDNVVLENIWVEHRRVGYWTNGPASNLIIRNSRFRNLHADAVNFYGAVANSVVEHCHVRNTGDDGLAAWSHDVRSPGQNNTFKNNYIQVPWKANCFGIYGGNDMHVVDNVCADVVQYSGMLWGHQFDSHAFGGLSTIERNTIVRGGGHAYGRDQAALRIYADQGAVDNLHFKDLDIIAPTYSGIQIQGPDYVGNTTLENVLIQDPGTSAFLLTWDSKGALDAINVDYVGGAPAFQVEDGAQFSVNQVGDENSGW